MKLVLITGGAGFIGSNIAAALVASGDYDVAICDRLGPADAGKWRNLSKHAIVDFLSPEALESWLAAHEGALEAIVHMGAISATTEADADLIINTNFVLSKRLWDWCALKGVRLIYASSAATYGAGAQGFVDQDDLQSLSRLKPLNPYGWSKALFDQFARRSSDRGSSPPQWVGLKFFNVYGPNEYHKGPMKSVIAQIWPKARQGERVSLFKSHEAAYADGGQLRDFVYVKDVDRVVFWLLDQPSVSGVFNLGTGRARTYKDLATATFAAADHSPNITYVDTPPSIREAYQYFTQADISRLRTVGFDEPFTSLEDGVADYVVNHLAQADPYR